MPLPIAPTTAPAAISTRPSSGKPIVVASSRCSALSVPSIHWLTTPTLTAQSRATESTAPTSPQMMPSITNGQRMNQLVAPTSFITSTSRRRAKIERRIVFPISRIEATSRIVMRASPAHWMNRATVRSLSVVSSPYLTPSASSIAAAVLICRTTSSACSAWPGLMRKFAGIGFELR